MHTEAKKQRLSILDAVRLIAALCIIVLHSFLEKNDFMNIYGAELLGRWPVGLFFMISGFFMSFRFKDTVIYCLKLLRVYVIWTIFYALWLHLDIWSPMRFLSALRSGIIMPFWYFSSLLMCVVLVSLLYAVTKDLRIVCMITGVLFVIAVMGCTFRYLPSISEFMDRFFFTWHERIIGVHHMRNGIFNGSFYIALGALLRKKYNTDKLRIVNVSAFRILLVISIILQVTEICLVIHFHTGEPDVLMTSPLLDALLIIFSFQYTMPEENAVLCRGMSNLIFLSHCFFLDIFQRLELAQWPVFIATVCCSLLFSYIIVSASGRIRLFRYLY